MRAEGVLRLILNVALFTTMRFELAEKFVRFVALEQPASSTTTATGDAEAAAFAEQVRRAVPRHRPGVAPMPGDEYA
jgi:hypothetical protein